MNVGSIIEPRFLEEILDEHHVGSGHVSDLRLMSGGTQNVLLSFARSDRRYVLRRPPLNKRPNSDETIRREARLLRALDATDVPHARLVAECGDEAAIGAAFYVTEEIDGVNPTVELPSRYRSDPTWRHRLGLALIDSSIAIASVDFERLGLVDFGHPEGFLSRQVLRWRNQLAGYSKSPAYTATVFVDDIAEWLESYTPSGQTPGLLHGDLHLANVLVDRESPRLLAVIDWELATIGDPLVDLGWILATWPDPSGPTAGTVGATPWLGFPSRDQLVDRYQAQTTRDLEAIGWYEVLACYKLAVILEGTYARSLDGLVDRRLGRDLHSNVLALLERGRRIVHG